MSSPDLPEWVPLASGGSVVCGGRPSPSRLTYWFVVAILGGVVIAVALVPPAVPWGFGLAIGLPKEAIAAAILAQRLDDELTRAFARDVVSAEIVEVHGTEGADWPATRVAVSDYPTVGRIYMTTAPRSLRRSGTMGGRWP